MKKRFVLGLVILTLVFNLCGCGNSENDNTEKELPIGDVTIKQIK